jgi:hypothetical protein
MCSSGCASTDSDLRSFSKVDNADWTSITSWRKWKVKSGTDYCDRSTYLFDIQLCQCNGNTVIEIQIEQVVDKILNLLLIRLARKAREALDYGGLKPNPIDLYFVLSR